MNDEIDNLSRLWDKPGENRESDPLAFLNKPDLADVKKVEGFWKSCEEEPPVNEGVLKKVLCHNCRAGFESKSHDKDIRCPECGSNESLSIYS